MTGTSDPAQDLVRFEETFGSGARVILGLAGLPPLLTPWELLVRPGVAPFDAATLLPWLVSAGALAVCLPLPASRCWASVRQSRSILGKAPSPSGQGARSDWPGRAGRRWRGSRRSGLDRRSGATALWLGPSPPCLRTGRHLGASRDAFPEMGPWSWRGMSQRARASARRPEPGGPEDDPATLIQRKKPCGIRISPVARGGPTVWPFTSRGATCVAQDPSGVTDEDGTEVDDARVRDFRPFTAGAQVRDVLLDVVAHEAEIDGARTSSVAIRDATERRPVHVADEECAGLSLTEVRGRPVAAPHGFPTRPREALPRSERAAWPIPRFWPRGRAPAFSAYRAVGRNEVAGVTATSRREAGLRRWPTGRSRAPRSSG